jgi:hypothetical protein
MKFKWFRDRSQTDLDAYMRTLQLYAWALPTPDKLKTPEEFARVFSRNLIGTWTNEAETMPSPMGQDVKFNADGTGYVSAAFFTGYSGRFEWREKGERLIEVRNGDESDAWYPLTWEISGPNAISLDCEEVSELTDLVDCLIADILFLSDGRGWSPTEGDDMPRDAEEIAVNGEAAWISQGDTSWELRQGPYKVTVANTDDDGKACYFFSVGFVAPGTGKRYTGVYDHALGHIDRETFLIVAARILSDLRRVYG